MAFDDVRAYVYESDLHCPDCTRRDVESGRLTLDPERRRKPGGEYLDSNGLPEWLVYRDEPVGAVFDADAEDPAGEVCGACGAVIVEPRQLDDDNRTDGMSPILCYVCRRRAAVTGQFFPLCAECAREATP